jgi:hypothetical protein
MHVKVGRFVKLKGSPLKGTITNFYSDPEKVNWDSGSPKFIEVTTTDGTVFLCHPNSLKMRL